MGNGSQKFQDPIEQTHTQRSDGDSTRELSSQESTSWIRDPPDLLPTLGEDQEYLVEK